MAKLKDFGGRVNPADENPGVPRSTHKGAGTAPPRSSKGMQARLLEKKGYGSRNPGKLQGPRSDAHKLPDFCHGEEAGEYGVVTFALVFLILAIFLFLAGAAVAFGWFGADKDFTEALGLVGLGSAAFAAAHLPV